MKSQVSSYNLPSLIPQLPEEWATVVLKSLKKVGIFVDKRLLSEQTNYHYSPDLIRVLYYGYSIADVNKKTKRDSLVTNSGFFNAIQNRQI